MKSSLSDFVDESIAVCCPPTPPGNIVSQRTEESSRLSSSVAQSSTELPASATHFLSPYALACSSVTQSSVLGRLSGPPMQEKSPSAASVVKMPSLVEANSPSTLSTLTQYPTENSLLPPSTMLGDASSQEETNTTDLVLGPPPAMQAQVRVATEAKGEQEGDALSAVPVIEVAPPQTQPKVGTVGCDPILTRGQQVPVLGDVGIHEPTPGPVPDKERVDDHGHAAEEGGLVGKNSTPTVIPAVVKEVKKRGRRPSAASRLKKSRTSTEASGGCRNLVRDNSFGSVGMFHFLTKGDESYWFCMMGCWIKSRWPRHPVPARLTGSLKGQYRRTLS